jgi:hypothetical protein
MMTNIEFLKMQKLAGLITENQYRTIILETTLSPEDQKIVNDILGENLEEGAFNLDKLKSYAKNGLITLAIASAIFGGANLSNDQKKEAGVVIKTEKAVDQDVKDMSQAQLALSLYKSHKKDKDLGSKIDSGLVRDLEYLITNKKENDVDQLAITGRTHRQDIQNFLNKMTNTNY